MPAQHLQRAASKLLVKPAIGCPGGRGRSPMPSRDRDLARGASGTSGATLPRTRHAKPARTGARQAALVTHLVVLVCVAGGVYIAWHQGTQGGGRGGVIAGGALLVAGAARVGLPTR